MAACGVGLPSPLVQSFHLHLPSHLSLWRLLVSSGAWARLDQQDGCWLPRDEVYIGTAENVLLRTTLTMTHSYMGPGHPRKLPGFTGERLQLFVS
jgi:hypothetical protein